MGENAGAAVLALALGLLGFGLIVAGVRGTYGAVWQAAKTAGAGDQPQTGSTADPAKAGGMAGGATGE